VGPGGGPDAMHFVWINAFTTMWLLALVLVVRWNGYALAAPGAWRPKVRNAHRR
jgi:hypothetical protein